MLILETLRSGPHTMFDGALAGSGSRNGRLRDLKREKVHVDLPWRHQSLRLRGDSELSRGTSGFCPQQTMK